MNGKAGEAQIMSDAGRNARWKQFAALIAFGCLVAHVAGCATEPERAGESASADPPPLLREFRGAWVAAVANIDWPSRKGLPVAEQKAEIVRIVEAAQALNLNALIVQVRPAADALYASSIEPWSEYLTGEEGRAPDPLYDPLRTWIDEAHRRGIAIHAWFNPYRARHPSATGPNAPSHISRTNPELVKRYGDSLWMDPGESAAAKRTLDVIVDVVRRYDIDGVHIDDYFYPYPVSVPGSTPPIDQEFPDDPSWVRCVLRPECDARTRADWRRGNVDALVESIDAAVHREKPWMRFGVSPFGIGRPDLRPPGITGFSQYDKLYADGERWLDRGWLDYLAPQLYWRRDDREHAFATLLDYWLSRNNRGRHVWPGLFTSRAVDADTGWPADEIAQQIAVVRGGTAEPGHVHFSIRPLVANRQGIADRLGESAYRSPALIPAAPWLGAVTLAAPAMTVTANAGNDFTISIRGDRGSEVRQYAAWVRAGGVWRLAVSEIVDVNRDTRGSGAATTLVIPAASLAGHAPEMVVAFAVDRYGNTGPAARWSNSGKQR